MITESRDLVDLGDLSAPKGSLPWVRGVFEEAKSALNVATTRIRDAKTWLKPLRDDGDFRFLADIRGRSFLTWEIFCETPQPHGLGHSAELVDSILDEPDGSKEVGAKLREHGANQHTREGGVDIINSSPPSIDGGTRKEYLRARLDRDRPDILSRLDAGEFPSVRAAALEAGIVQPSFQCPEDPLKASRRLLKHFSGEALTTLLTELANHAGFDLTPRG